MLVITAVVSIADSKVMQSYVRPPFIYYYSGTDSTKFINATDILIRSWLKTIEGKIEVDLPRQIRIYFSLTRKDFAIQTQGRAPSWAGGLAITNRNLIFVKAPLFFREGIPVEVITAHEISHILIHRATKGNYVPRWFSEGLCSVLAGESRRGSASRLSRAVLAKRLLGLPRVDGVLHFSSQDAALAYAEATSAVSYFIERFEWLAITDLFKHIAQDKNFEEAFFLATGVEYEIWQVEWMDYARRRYRWGALMEIDNMIWTFIALFGSTVVIWAYIKKRIQLRRWQDDDDDDEFYYDDDNPIVPE